MTKARPTIRRRVLAEHRDRLEFIVVPDITKVRRLARLIYSQQGCQFIYCQAGAFDEAVVGIDAVVHTAEDPNDHIGPAVEGTLGVLRSASVKRVVFVSTGAAVVDFFATEPRAYDEAAWNEVDIREVETKGRAASVASKYRASKTIAARRAWEFYEQEKEKAKGAGKEHPRWDLVTINPPWLFEPVLNEIKGGPESLNLSNSYWYDAVVKGEFVDRGLE